MKKIINLLTIICLTSLCALCQQSCKIEDSSKAIKTLLTKYEDSTYQYSLYSVNKKCDKDLNPQCNNYFSSKNTEDGYSLISASLPTLITRLYDIEKEQIHIEKQPKCFYIFEYSSKNHSATDSLVAKDILKALKLNVDIKSETKNAYFLSVSDENKAKKHIGNKNKEAKASGNYTALKITNFTLKAISKVINNKYPNDYITTESDSEEVYSFNLKCKLSIDKQIENLNKYGFTLTQKKLTLKHYYFSTL